MFGVVTDENGEGLSDVKIVLEPVGGEGGAKVQVASKGKKGAYFFGLIRPGTYHLKVEAADRALLSAKANATLANSSEKSRVLLDGKVNPQKPPELRIEDAM